MVIQGIFRPLNTLVSEGRTYGAFDSLTALSEVVGSETYQDLAKQLERTDGFQMNPVFNSVLLEQVKAGKYFAPREQTAEDLETDPGSVISRGEKKKVYKASQPLPLEDFFQILHPSGNDFLERKNNIVYGAMRVKKTRRYRYIIGQKMRIVDYDYLQNKYRQGAVLYSSLSKAVGRHDLQEEACSSEEIYLACPYERLGVGLFFDARMEVQWNRPQKHIIYQDNAGLISGDAPFRKIEGIASEEDLFEYFGRRWREEDRQILQQAIGNGLEITHLSLEDYLKSNGLTKKRNHHQGIHNIAYLVKERKKAVAFLKVPNSPAIFRDEVMALLKMQRMLESIQEKRIRTARILAIGPNYYIREFLPSQQVYDFIQDAEQKEKDKEVMLQIRSIFRNVRDPSLLLIKIFVVYLALGTNLGREITDNGELRFIIYDPI